MPVKTINEVLQDEATRRHILKRGGIVPYVRFRAEDGTEETFYCFGVDYGSGDITDLSGRRDRDDTTILKTAIREFTEETLNVFPKMTEEAIKAQEALVVYDDLSMMMFVQFDLPNLQDVLDRFQAALKVQKGDPELSMLFWMTERQIRAALMAPKPIVFYYPTGRLLVSYFSDSATDQCA